MTADEMRRAVARLAHEIVERHGGTDDLAIIGIQRRGAILAHRLAEAIVDHEATRLPVGTLDISLYRDDLTELATYPIVRPTDLPFDITGRTLVLVDDVLFTGRTVRAALDAFRRSRAAPRGPPGRLDGPRSPRTSHPGRLRRSKPAHRALGNV